MIRRLIISAAVALAAACASAPDRPAEARDPREKDPAFRYGRNPGPSPVGAIPDIVLTDTARKKPFKLSIDYPTRGGPHPLIILSHGGGLSNRSYPGLVAHWVSYGYVIIRPNHDDPASPEDMTPAKWRERTGDIAFVIDSLSTLQEQYPELQGKIDANRIAVVGHARGAATAMMIGGLRTFPGPASYADPRVKAITAFSPVGPLEMWGVTNESFAGIGVPALFVTGSLDTGASEAETPQWRQQAFELAPAGDKWLVTIEGVSSNTFTGLATPVVADRPAVVLNPRIDPMDARREAERQQMSRARLAGADQRALFEAIRSLALAFFDTYLKDDANGRQFLTEADGRANVDVKRK